MAMPETEGLNCLERLVLALDSLPVCHCLRQQTSLAVSHLPYVGGQDGCGVRPHAKSQRQKVQQLDKLSVQDGFHRDGPTSPSPYPKISGKNP